MSLQKCALCRQLGILSDKSSVLKETIRFLPQKQIPIREEASTSHLALAKDRSLHILTRQLYHIKTLRRARCMGHCLVVLSTSASGSLMSNLTRVLTSPIPRAGVISPAVLSGKGRLRREILINPHVIGASRLKHHGPLHGLTLL